MFYAVHKESCTELSNHHFRLSHDIRLELQGDKLQQSYPSIGIRSLASNFKPCWAYPARCETFKAPSSRIKLAMPQRPPPVSNTWIGLFVNAFIPRRRTTCAMLWLRPLARFTARLVSNSSRVRQWRASIVAQPKLVVIQGPSNQSTPVRTKASSWHRISQGIYLSFPFRYLSTKKLLECCRWRNHPW